MVPAKQSRPLKIFTTQLLRATWDESRDATKAPGAPGVDRQSAENFIQNLNANIQDVHRRIINGDYTLHHLRPHFIPKKNSDKERLICVPTVTDRLVQRRIAEHFLKNDKLKILNDVSFGFIKGRKLTDAIDAAVALRNKYPWALKADIVSYFDTIDRSKLIDRLQRALGSRHSLMPLLHQVISNEVAVVKGMGERLTKTKIRKGRGLRQGMPLSPLLSNFVLRKFDQGIVRAKLQMVRYADDFVILCASKDECLKADGIVRRLLDQVNHEIPALNMGGKAQIANPQEPVEFLGLDIVRKSDGNYKKQIPGEVFRKAIAEISALGVLDEYRRTSKRARFSDVAGRILACGRGYLGSYKTADNYADFEPRINAAMRKAAGSLVAGIFGAEAVDNLDNWSRVFLGLDVGASSES